MCQQHVHSPYRFHCWSSQKKFNLRSKTLSKERFQVKCHCWQIIGRHSNPTMPFKPKLHLPMQTSVLKTYYRDYFRMRDQELCQLHRWELVIHPRNGVAREEARVPPGGGEGGHSGTPQKQQNHAILSHARIQERERGRGSLLRRRSEGEEPGIFFLSRVTGGFEKGRQASLPPAAVNFWSVEKLMGREAAGFEGEGGKWGACRGTARGRGG